MKNILILLCVLVSMLIGCSSHTPSYQFRTYSDIDNTNASFRIIVNGYNDVDISVYGNWNKNYYLLHGYESWFPSIIFAKSAIEKGNLSGSWLDSCKNKVVYWKSENTNFRNATIIVNDAIGLDRFIP